MRIYRVNAVGKNGKPEVLATADTAIHAVALLDEAMIDNPRAWVTDEYDTEVPWVELVARAEEERKAQERPGGT